jgi:excisionase family DNA binding protein
MIGALPMEAEALRLVTIRQAAEILAVDERTVRRLIARCELRAIGCGRLTRIAIRDIADYQNRNRR